MMDETQRGWERSSGGSRGAVGGGGLWGEADLRLRQSSASGGATSGERPNTVWGSRDLNINSKLLSIEKFAHVAPRGGFGGSGTFCPPPPTGSAAVQFARRVTVRSRIGTDCGHGAHYRRRRVARRRCDATSCFHNGDARSFS